MSKEKLNIDKVDKMSTELASVISMFMARPGMKWNEAFIIIITGVSKMLQMIAKLSGFPQKELVAIICDGIKSYFEHGGDGRIDEAIKYSEAMLNKEASEIN